MHFCSPQLLQYEVTAAGGAVVASCSRPQVYQLARAVVVVTHSKDASGAAEEHRAAAHLEARFVLATLVSDS